MKTLSSWTSACIAISLASMSASAQDLAFRPFTNVGSLAVALRHANDSTGKLYAVTQNGTIRVVNSNGSLVTTPFLSGVGSLSCAWAGTTYTPGFAAGGERGLLGLAFHPQYASNRRFYINFTDTNGHTTVAELQASAANPDVADTASCKVLLRINQDFSNHNGGNVLFGPDGFLYVGMGDGGSGGDPCNRAQTLVPGSLNDAGECAVKTNFNTVARPGNADSRALLGKMLRLDVDGSTAAGHSLCGVPSNAAANFAVPTSNAFPGNVSKCPETFYYGLRNPWRWSFDKSTGDLVIGDVGQNASEEISFVLRGSGFNAGLNFGWNCFEGELNFSSSGTCSGASLANTHDPVMPLLSGVAASITGGYIYRGPATNLVGKYITADYQRSLFYLGTPANLTAPGTPQANWAVQTFTNASLGFTGTVTSFGEDAAGNVYVLTASGAIFKIADPREFADGFE
jgi:glucose/arabinose dehydrogenase